MAMVQCGECSADISETAKHCPHCGWKRPSQFRWRPLLIGAAVVGGIAIFNNAGGVLEPFYPLIPSIHQRLLVKSMLYDPESATFRGERESTENKVVWCGEVNAKNRMGGLVGFQRYVVDFTGYSGMPVVYFDNGDDVQRFTVYWDGYCR